MSYTVLARKFRSQTFDEIVGQGAITTTLKNAITQDRVHHGYLFCGTRGVGKTSMARILAKALNCLATDKPTPHPCGECDACKCIARGEDVDVVEIDAASHTGVDNIRELRSNAVYRPTRCRFKIYIIDEVHMLSTGAFNALLKTLEEPPDHVKFILATTESHKIPATILSRVQRFDFKSILASDIAAQLTTICQSEQVKIEEAAANRLARLANGSMRDALSLMDQVLSMAEGDITSEGVDELFPAAHDELFAELIDCFALSDAAGALAVVDRSLSEGHTLDNWCTLLIGQLRDLMILRVCGGDTPLVDTPVSLRPQLVEQSQKFDSGTFVYMITVLEELRRSVKSSSSSRALIEAAIIRLAEAANFSSIESLIASVGQQGSPSTPARSTAARSSQWPAVPSVKKNETANVTHPQAPGGDRSAGAVVQSVGAAVRTGSASMSSQIAAPSRRGPLAEPQATAIPPARRATLEDIKAAEAEPTIRAALDLFGGQIVDVQISQAARKVPAGAVPEKSDG